LQTHIGSNNNDTLDYTRIVVDSENGFGIMTDGFNAYFRSDNLTANTTLQAPDTSGTIATQEWVDEEKVYTQKTTLTVAELLSIDTSPITLLAAPGAGKLIQIITCEWRVRFATAAYTGSTTLFFRYAGGNAVILTSSAPLVSTTSRIGKINTSASSGATSIQGLENAGIVLSAGGSGNPSTGDSEVDLYLSYKIITL
jgi:hypothetical protein